MKKSFDEYRKNRDLVREADHNDIINASRDIFQGLLNKGVNKMQQWGNQLNDRPEGSTPPVYKQNPFQRFGNWLSGKLGFGGNPVEKDAVMAPETQATGTNYGQPVNAAGLLDKILDKAVNGNKDLSDLGPDMAYRLPNDAHIAIVDKYKDKTNGMIMGDAREKAKQEISMTMRNNGYTGEGLLPRKTFQEYVATGRTM